MAWFRNSYQCPNCKTKWEGKWSCMVDESCPRCRTKDISPYGADELIHLVVERGDAFVVLRSPETAEHSPDYAEIAEFATQKLAEAFIIDLEENES
jgi:hypothetical protein